MLFTGSILENMSLWLSLQIMKVRWKQILWYGHFWWRILWCGLAAKGLTFFQGRKVVDWSFEVLVGGLGEFLLKGHYINMGRHQEGTVTSKEWVQTSPIVVWLLQHLVIIYGHIHKLFVSSLLFLYLWGTSCNRIPFYFSWTPFTCSLGFL